MANNKDALNEAAWGLSKSMQATNQAIAGSAVAAQERNAKFVQGVIENGVEVLKSHVESTQALMQELVENPGKAQGAYQVLAESVVAAQERNMKFAQSFLQTSTETLKKHVDSSRALMQELAEQSRHQQEAFQVLTHGIVDAYLDLFFSAPLSYYGQTLDTVESIAWQGVDTTQKIVRQGLEVVQKAVRPEKSAARAATQ